MEPYIVDVFCWKVNLIPSRHYIVREKIDQDFQGWACNLACFLVKLSKYRGYLPRSDNTAKFVVDLCNLKIDLQNLRGFSHSKFE